MAGGPGNHESFPQLPVEKPLNYPVNRMLQIINVNNPTWIHDNLTASETTPHIISVGAGAGIELIGLSNLFPSADIVGIDLNPLAYTSEKSKYTVRRADARNAESYKDRQRNPVDNYNLIIMRSPGPGLSTEGVWPKVVEESKKHLGAEGIIYCTLNNEGDRQNMTQIMTNAGLNITEIRDNKPPDAQALSPFPENIILLAKLPQP